MNYTATERRLTESRLDWITCTSSRVSTAADLYAFGALNAEKEKRAGDRWERYSFQGYRGAQCGRWRFGYSDQGSIVVVSGSEAQEAAPVLAKMADHWSRVDYCTTVQMEDSDATPDEAYWADWRWHKNPDRAPISLARLQAVGKGATVDLGARESAVYYRIYDKAAESKGEYPQGSWRWEAELKQHRAESEQRAWKSGQRPPHYAHRLLSQALASYGLSVPWSPSSRVEIGRSPIRVRDADRSLGWLEHQVAPTVEWVREARGDAKVLKALGLPTYEIHEVLDKLTPDGELVPAPGMHGNV